MEQYLISTSKQSLITAVAVVAERVSNADTVVLLQRKLDRKLCTHKLYDCQSKEESILYISLVKVCEFAFKLSMRQTQMSPEF